MHRQSIMASVSDCLQQLQQLDNPYRNRDANVIVAVVVPTLVRALVVVRDMVAAAAAVDQSLAEVALAAIVAYALVVNAAAVASMMMVTDRMDSFLKYLNQ